MIRGETVRIRVPGVILGHDALNDPIYGSDERDIENVLVAPGSRADLEDAARTGGDKIIYNLHFPKTFHGSLRGGEIKVRGEWLAVVGDPRPYTPENTPGQWNMPVEVQTVKG